MKIYELKNEHLLKITMDEAWRFFSNPSNLNEITPPDMKFEITNNPGTEMYAGQIITYRIEIFPGINQNWVTEIKNVAEKKFFIDEQRFGPYKFWHHKHIFEEVENGILMTDLVHYALPFGFLGSIAHALFVKRKLNNIFDYRFNHLEKMFND
ncbi:MAG: SRPBCC family protein [Melioribacteraceae bacterium]|nr:SRPBCC family protein [Melioribacteraceae bacterium]MCF8356753.1 SRPBCC family protein [Melioribacteraceae bacterium]MCF8396142.1 SRPBCC family protein [Melioribacteraceae bacterium]MCF8421119.1 SRPBCC family protein [Melioribacteraceae bacterium]